MHMVPPGSAFDLTTTEAADYLHVTSETIRRWVRAEKITYFRSPGGQYRFRRSDLDAMVAA